jgi:hypothetical protein
MAGNVNFFAHAAVFLLTGGHSGPIGSASTGLRANLPRENVVMFDVIARLEALAAAPKPWIATIHCDNGTTRTLRQPTKAMAVAHAEHMATKKGFVRAVVEYSPE